MHKLIRSELLAKLEAVKPGLYADDSTATSCFVFRDGLVSTFNTEVFCRAHSGLPKDVNAAIHYKPLLNLLDKLTEPEVKLSQKDGELLVTGTEGREAGFKVDHDYKLDLSKLEDHGKQWYSLPEDFDKAVAVCSACAQTDPNDFEPSCVHLTAKHLEATDRRQLIRYKLALGIKHPFLVRAVTLGSITNLGLSHYSETANWLHFRNQANWLVISCRRFVMDFPALDKVLAVKGTKPLELPSDLLTEVKRAEIASQDSMSDSRLLVELWPGHMGIQVTGDTSWFRRKFKLSYDGPMLKVLIDPKMLKELCKRTSKVQVGDARIVAEGENWKYVAALSKGVQGR